MMPTEKYGSSMPESPAATLDSLPQTRCSRCGKPYHASDLRRASVPPVLSIAAATDIEPGDVEPPLTHTDGGWYCPSCRLRVNLQRGIGAVIVLVSFMLALAIARH
jgi:hypothetical protein